MPFEPKFPRDSEEWIHPPKLLDEKGLPTGEPLMVDVRFAIFKMEEVDTKTLSASIKIALVWYWNDPRLAGWDEDVDLPDKLWGPHCLLVNSRLELTSEQTQFELVDAKTGRLKRGRMFHGPIDNDMNLADFPFDTDDVTVHWESVSHWMSKDGERTGSLAKGQSYQLYPIDETKGEGKLVGLYFSGDISEWKLLGVNTLLQDLKPTPQGTIRTKLELSFALARQPAFYFWKVVLPLYLLVGLSWSTFDYDVDDLGSPAG